MGECADSVPVVRRLVGVYNADGSAIGELIYFIGARLGRTHCALCDITHGRVRERDDWKMAKEKLAVPFETYHRDDQPAAVRAAGGALPVVVAITDERVVTILESPDLIACGGTPSRLLERIDDAVRRLGLQWPP